MAVPLLVGEKRLPARIWRPAKSSPRALDGDAPMIAGLITITIAAVATMPLVLAVIA